MQVSTWDYLTFYFHDCAAGNRRSLHGFADSLEKEKKTYALLFLYLWHFHCVRNLENQGKNCCMCYARLRVMAPSPFKMASGARRRNLFFFLYLSCGMKCLTLTSTWWPTFCVSLWAKTDSVTLMFNSAIVFDERFCLVCDPQGGASVVNLAYKQYLQKKVGWNNKCQILRAGSEWRKIFSLPQAVQKSKTINPKQTRAFYTSDIFLWMRRAFEWRHYEITSLEWLMWVWWHCLLLPPNGFITNTQTHFEVPLLYKLLLCASDCALYLRLRFQWNLEWVYWTLDIAPSPHYYMKLKNKH